MSLNSITQSQLNDDRRSRIAANEDGGYRKSDYAKALDGVNPAFAPQDRIGSDYEQLRAVASAGERGMAGPQRRAEADQDLENVVGDSLRRSAYQQDEDQRATAEAGNQLRFNAMSDDERLRFDILGDQKNWGDADPDDFSFRMGVLEMMQNQRREDKDRQAYDQQQAVLAERAESQYQFDIGQQNRFLEQQRLDDEDRAYRTSAGYDWRTDTSLSGDEQLGMAMSADQLGDYYATKGKDPSGTLFADRTPGDFIDADFGNVDLGRKQKEWNNVGDAAVETISNIFSRDPDAKDVAKKIEEFDNGLLLDDADDIINSTINQGGDRMDIRRALNELVKNYQSTDSDEKIPDRTIEMLMAYASLGQ